MEGGASRPTPAPTYASAATEDLLDGMHLLRRVFLDAPQASANRDTVVIAADAPEPPALMINRGLAYGASSLPDGRRSIADIWLPTDIVGLDHAVLGRSNRDIVAAGILGYRWLSAAKLRELLQDPRIALCALALAGQARWRHEHHLLTITRFDARGRLAAMILGIYERLRRPGLVTRPTFNLPLTQEQIADHLGITMVHVSRTLRRLREEKLVLVDRQVVIILDLNGLRRAASSPDQASDGVGTDDVRVGRLIV